MRRATVLVGLLCVSAVAEDDAGDAARRASVEIVSPRTTYFVQEPVRLTLRVGFDAAYFRSSVVATFRRAMDVPLHVQAPALRALPGTPALPGVLALAVPAADGGRRRTSFALGDGVTDAARAEDRVEDGRTWTVLEVDRDVLPTTAGELTIPAPQLRFTYGTRFEDDLVNGRVALDPREARVDGAPLTLRILPLPAEGRPSGFTGAVGRFTVEAAAAARDVAAGESLKLALVFSGEGNLAHFDAPRLDGLPGFHVYGAIDDRDATGATRAARRTVTYDLAPLGADVTSVPEITFSYFDPHPPAGYRTVRTQPIPLTVRPRRGDANGAAGVAGGPADAKGGDARARGGASTTTLVAAAVLVVLGACAFALLRRSMARRAADPDRERALGAAAAFRARAAAPGVDLADAFAEFLAAHLRCGVASVIAPDLPAKLVAAGVPAELAGRAGTLLERLVAARYGGGATSDVPADVVRATVDALDVSFRDPTGVG